MITLTAAFLAGINSNPAAPLTFSAAYSTNGTSWTDLTTDNGIILPEGLSAETELEPFDFVGPDLSVHCENGTGFWTNPQRTGLLDSGARIYFRFRTANSGVTTEWVTHIQGPVDLASVQPDNPRQVCFVVRGTLNVLDYFQATTALAVASAITHPKKFNGWLLIDSIGAGHDTGLFPLEYNSEKKTLQWNYGEEVDIPETFTTGDDPLALEDYLGNTLYVWAWQKQHIMEAGGPSEWYIRGKLPENDIVQFLVIRDNSGTLEVNQPGMAKSSSDILEAIEDAAGVALADHSVFVPVNGKDKPATAIDVGGYVGADYIITDILGYGEGLFLISLSKDSSYIGNSTSALISLQTSDGSASARGGLDEFQDVKSYGISPLFMGPTGKAQGAKHTTDYHRALWKAIRLIRMAPSTGAVEELSDLLDVYVRSIVAYDADTYYLLQHTTIGKSKLYRVDGLGTEASPASTETLVKDWEIQSQWPCTGAACESHGYYVAAAESEVPSATGSPLDAMGEGNIIYKFIVYDIANARLYKINLPIDDFAWDEDNVYVDGNGLAVPVITKLIDAGGENSFSVLATIGQIYRGGDYADTGWNLRGSRQRVCKINLDFPGTTLASGQIYAYYPGVKNVFSLLCNKGVAPETFVGKIFRFTSGTNSGCGTTIKSAELWGDDLGGAQPSQYIQIYVDNALPGDASGTAVTWVIEDFYIQKTVKEYTPKRVDFTRVTDRRNLAGLAEQGSMRSSRARSNRSFAPAKTITEDVAFELTDSSGGAIGDEICLSNPRPIYSNEKLVIAKSTIYRFNEGTQKLDYLTNTPASQDGQIVAAAFDAYGDRLVYATERAAYFINITGQSYDFAVIPFADFEDNSCRDVVHNLAVLRNAIAIPSEHSGSLTFKYRGTSPAFTDFTLAPRKYRYNYSFRPYFPYTGVDLDGYFVGTKDGLVLSVTSGLVQPASKRALAIDILTKLYTGARFHQVETDWQIFIEPGDSGVLQINDETSGTPTTRDKNVMVLGVNSDKVARTHTLTLLEF